MEDAEIFYVKTRNKTPQEVDEFQEWMNENCIEYMYAGQQAYWVQGKYDAFLVRITWS